MCCICHQAEQYALQNLHEPRRGRGWSLALEIKPLAKTKPLTPWKKRDLAYWGQFCSLLQHVASKRHIATGTMVHLKAKAADLQIRWQDLQGLVDFQAGLEALINGDATPLTLLIKGAECNKDQAQKIALGWQADEYRAWLSQATLRGQSGIYRCLKAPDAVHFDRTVMYQCSKGRS